MPAPTHPEHADVGKSIISFLAGHGLGTQSLPQHRLRDRAGSGQEHWAELGMVHRVALGLFGTAAARAAAKSAVASSPRTAGGTAPVAANVAERARTSEGASGKDSTLEITRRLLNQPLTPPAAHSTHGQKNNFLPMSDLLPLVRLYAE